MALYPKSSVMGLALGERLDSMEWMRASMELVAKTDRAGSSAARGPAQPCRRTCRGAQTLLGVQEMRARMERLVTSLPVPQVVGTRMSSFPFSRGSCRHTGPGWG